MKPNSSVTASTIKPGIGIESPPPMSRRSALITIGMLFFAPRFAMAQVFRCGNDLRIGILLSLTGPDASVGNNYFMGAKEAVRAANLKGCSATLVVQDASPSPFSLMKGALISGQRDRASVIIAPFGPTAGQIAEKVKSALIFDISQTSPTKSKPDNLVVLPYSLFFTANPDLKNESLQTIGRVAVTIVLETIQQSDPGSISSPSDMVNAMARRRFISPIGKLTLNRNTGAFELVK